MTDLGALQKRYDAAVKDREKKKKRVDSLRRQYEMARNAHIDSSEFLSFLRDTLRNAATDITS